MSRRNLVPPTSRSSNRTLLVVALLTLGGSAAEAGHGHAQHRAPRRAAAPNPIYRTLDSVAGGLDLLVEKSLSSTRKMTHFLTGGRGSQACDDLPCDAMLLDGLPTERERLPEGVLDIHDESTWKLVPCEEDDQCDPRSLNALPMHKGGLPFASDAIQGPVELLPLKPVPRSPQPEAPAPPVAPSRPTPAPPKAVPSPSQGQLGEQAEEDWFEEFSPTIPPVAPTPPPAAPDTTDPFQDDQPAKTPAASEIPTTDGRSWVEPVKERDLQPRSGRMAMPLTAPANRATSAKKVSYRQPASRARR